jgi:hypothetical protein
MSWRDLKDDLSTIVYDEGTPVRERWSSEKGLPMMNVLLKPTGGLAGLVITGIKAHLSGHSREEEVWHEV